MEPYKFCHFGYKAKMCKIYTRNEILKQNCKNIKQKCYIWHEAKVKEAVLEGKDLNDNWNKKTIKN